MKKKKVEKKLLLLVALIMMFTLIGCSSKNESTDSLKDKDKTVEENKSEEKSNDNSLKEEQNEKEEENQEQDKIKDQDVKNKEEKEEESNEEENSSKKELTLIIPTADGTTFEESLVEVEEITPKTIITELANKGIIANDISVLDLTSTELNGEKLLDLNVNQAFQDMLMKQGSNGEWYMLGSVCNTFLKAYNADKIKVQVEGNVLETGHNSYDQYMSMFVE